MKGNYSQLRAMWAITRGSMKAIFRSPQAVFFSLFFPIVLISIFSAIGGNGGISIDVSFDPSSDTTNILYQTLTKVPVLVVNRGTAAQMEDNLVKGRITAIVSIHPVPGAAGPQYDIHLKTSSAGQREVPILQSVLKEVITRINSRLYPVQPSFASISKETVSGRPYRMIDFYLPGMIGFSLIGSAVFGVAFLFYSLRETLVLKRMYSSPVQKVYIVVGESISRVLFQLCTVVVLIVFGKYVYHFTLANGFITFIDMLVLSFVSLLVFMGFGFLISGIAKNQNVIPVYANLFMFPQYFLSGTFFPRSALPEGLQAIIKYLPLTAVNDAMRRISFEGASLFSCWRELLVLFVWALIAYALTVKTFKWE